MSNNVNVQIDSEDEVATVKSTSSLLPRKTKVTKDGKPGYHCSNCKCDRYNPCRCTKKS